MGRIRVFWSGKKEKGEIAKVVHIERLTSRLKRLTKRWYPQHPNLAPPTVSQAEEGIDGSYHTMSFTHTYGRKAKHITWNGNTRSFVSYCSAVVSVTSRFSRLFRRWVCERLERLFRGTRVRWSFRRFLKMAKSIIQFVIYCSFNFSMRVITMLTVVIWGKLRFFCLYFVEVGSQISKVWYFGGFGHRFPPNLYLHISSTR